MSTDEIVDLVDAHFFTNCTPEEKLKRVNRARNYLRYRLATNKHVNYHRFNSTPEERFLLSQYNDYLEAITQIKIALFIHFYENCPKLGSTLKRKPKKDEMSFVPETGLGTKSWEI